MWALESQDAVQLEGGRDSARLEICEMVSVMALTALSAGLFEQSVQIELDRLMD